MKKALLGLVIAVMMIGSGYAGIHKNGSKIELTDERYVQLSEFCFDAIAKGRLIITPSKPDYVPSYVYNGSIVRIGGINTYAGLNCNIKDTFYP